MGYHSFSDFVSSLRLGALQLSILPNSQDRIIFDPVRHSIDGNLTSVSLAASILRTAKLPQISAIDYCSILNVFWVTLKDEAFDITASSNSTYALCIQWEKKPSISLQAITSLLQGLVFNGFDPRKYYASPEDLMVDSCAVVLAEWARQNLVSFVDNDTRMKFMDWVKDGAENAIRLDRPAEAL